MEGSRSDGNPETIGLGRMLDQESQNLVLKGLLLGGRDCPELISIVYPH
jgi:hypothetical protein